MEGSFPPNTFQNSSAFYDIEFWEIYFQAAKKLLNFEKECNADYLNRYYEIFRKYFNIHFGIFRSLEIEDHGRETIKLLKESLYYRIIYILRHSPVLSSAVAFHFQNALEEDFSYLKELIKKDKIKICSIGGGPASDIVAIVKILDSIASKMNKQLDFRITVLDSDANWKTACFTVLSCLKNFRRATWKINFIQVDISDRNTYSTEVINSIKDADITLMVMLLYDFKNANLDAKETVKNVSELMQYGAMLFLLDLELIEHIRSCFGLLGHTENCCLVYENLSDAHILNETTNYSSYTSYKKYFPHLICNYELPVFVRAWIKTQTKEVSGDRSELRRRFKKDIEQFDPERIFRDHDFFESWLIKRVDEKRKAGRSEKFINEYLQDKRRNRIFFLDKLAESKKRVETARKELVNENVQLEEREHNKKNKFEVAWEEYIIEKKYYNYLKKCFYQNFFFDRSISYFKNII